MPQISLSNIKPYAIISAITLVLLIFGLLTLIVFRYRSKPLSPASPSPTSYRPSTPPLTGAKIPRAPEFEQELNKIKKSLPYQGPDYLIEFLEQLNIVIVDIKNAKSREHYLRIKRQAEESIKSLGVQNICALHILWKAPEEQQIRELLYPLDMVTTNCL